MAFTGFGVVAQTKPPRSAWLRRQAYLVLILALVWRLGAAQLFRRDEVSQVLHELNLDEYISEFHSHGFEQLTELSHVTDVELRDQLGVALLGHRKRILCRLALLREAALQPSTAQVAMRWALFAVTMGTAATALAAVVAGLLLYQAPQLRKSLLESFTVFGLVAWYNARKLQQTNGLPDWVCRSMLHAERMYALINAPPASFSPMTPGSSHNLLANHSRSASQTSVVTAPAPSESGDAPPVLAGSTPVDTPAPSAVEKPRRKWSLGGRKSGVTPTTAVLNRTPTI